MSVIIMYLPLLMLCVGHLCEANNRRKMTRIQQDLEFLRDQVIDLRHDMDDLYSWKNITAGSSPASGDEEQELATNKGHFDRHSAQILIKNIEQFVQHMEKRMSYVISGTEDEKTTIRELVADLTNEVRQSIENMREYVNSAAKETDEVRDVANSNKKYHVEMFSDLTSRLEQLDRRVTVLGVTRDDQCKEAIQKIDEDRYTTKMNNGKVVHQLNDFSQRLDAMTKRNDEFMADTSQMMQTLYFNFLNQNGWLRYDRSFYKLFTSGVTFQKAVDICEENGASLVVDPYPGEVEFLLGKFGRDVFWLGASDQDVEDKWTWLSGETLKGDNWSPGQPDDYRNNEDCLVSGGKYKTLFNDYPCDSKNQFPCKM